MKFLFDLNNLAMRILHLPMVHADSETSFNGDFWAYKIFDDMFNFVINYSAGDPIEDIIFACDHKEGYWRKDIYSPYKGNRKKDSNIHWPTVWEEYSRFKEALKTYTPIKVLEVPRCEADDVIAVIAKNSDTPCIIYSGDCDYLQLMDDNIRVVQPHHGERSFPADVKIGATKVFCTSAEEFIELSVLTGQGRKDNVFNVLTPTDWEPNEHQKRMAPFGIKKIQKLQKTGELQSFLENNEYVDNYNRNKTLIDLREIPKELQKEILKADSEYIKSCPNMVDFLIEYKWQSYLQNHFDYVELLMQSVYE